MLNCSKINSDLVANLVGAVLVRSVPSMALDSGGASSASQWLVGTRHLCLIIAQLVLDLLQTLTGDDVITYFVVGATQDGGGLMPLA